MHVAWIQAALYDPPVVLGRKLKPLSPLHLLVLDSVKSPFAVGGVADLQDLVLAVHICCSGWDTRGNLFADKAALQAWGAEQAKVDWREMMLDFYEYLSESWTVPEKWSNGDARQCKANGAYHLALFGMRYLGMTEAQAWDCPVARLVCYRETFNEAETGESMLVGSEIDDAKKAAEGTDGHAS